MSRLHRLATASLVLALVTFPTAASAQTATPTAEEPTASEEPTVASSVSLLPRDAAPDDPHGGTWFLFTLDAGGSGRAVASLTNSSDTAARVDLRLRDLRFTEDGTPELGPPDAGVAAWGAFERPQVVVPPATTIPVAFQLTVPSGTSPGDHIGAAVAVTRHDLDGTELVQQVATRIVVTVPGDVARSLEITGIDLERTGGLFPGPIVARITVRNTGTIRLAPRVTVAGEDAAGSRLLTRESADTYIAEIDTPVLGGVVRLPVEVTDASGVTRRVDESVLVVPWWLVALLVLAVVAVLLRRQVRGPAPDSTLQADVRRLERLVVDVQRRLDAALASPASLDEDTTPGDRVNALELSLVRARRSGEWEVFAALALALHEATGDATAVLAEASRYDTSYREELAAALATTATPATPAN